MVCKTFDKETTSLTVKIASGGAAKRATSMRSTQTKYKKIEKRKVYSSFI